MATLKASTGNRRSSGEVFDPTAYAVRRKEKVEAAAALREQRKRDQEKRESDRGSAPIPTKNPPVDYTFAPETPKQAGSTPVPSSDTPVVSDGPNYLKPLMRRGLTVPSTPQEEKETESPTVSEAKPSPNTSSFAQALPPFRSPTLTKTSKKRLAVRSPPHQSAPQEEAPSPPPEEVVEAPPPAVHLEDDAENQAPPVHAHLTVEEKKVSPARTALSLLKSKLRLSKPKPAPAAPLQNNPSPAQSLAPPQRAVLSPTQGQNQDANARVQPPLTAIGRKEERKIGAAAEEGSTAVPSEEGEARRLSFGSKLVNVLGSRKWKEAANVGNSHVGGESQATRGQSQGPNAEWQPPDEELPEGAALNMRPCSDCGRKFSDVALAKHAKICRKVFGQKRKAFNVAAHRLEGTDAAKFVQQQGPPGRGAKASASSSKGRGETSWAHGNRSNEARPLKKLPAWKQQSQQLQAAIQASRTYAQAKAKGVDLASLPPPPPAENPDYVGCPHCSRRFAPLVAERHIPKCKDTVNRPKPVTKRPAQVGALKNKGKAKK